MKDQFSKNCRQPSAGEDCTGIGLAIAKKIVDLHNGEICEKNAQNMGSNFYFTLPAKH